MSSSTEHSLETSLTERGLSGIADILENLQRTIVVARGNPTNIDDAIVQEEDALRLFETRVQRIFDQVLSIFDANRDQVRRTFAANLSQLREKRNALIRINTLPDELLEDILLYWRSYRYAPSCMLYYRPLATVCRRWRYIVINRPRFWTHINLGASLSCLKIIIERSKALSLDIQSHCRYRRGSWGLVGDVATRIRSFHVDFSFMDPQNFLQFLPSNTSSLRSISINHQQHGTLKASSYPPKSIDLKASVEFLFNSIHQELGGLGDLHTLAITLSSGTKDERNRCMKNMQRVLEGSNDLCTLDISISSSCPDEIVLEPSSSSLILEHLRSVSMKGHTCLSLLPVYTAPNLQSFTSVIKSNTGAQWYYPHVVRHLNLHKVKHLNICGAWNVEGWNVEGWKVEGWESLADDAGTRNGGFHLRMEFMTKCTIHRHFLQNCTALERLEFFGESIDEILSKDIEETVLTESSALHIRHLVLQSYGVVNTLFARRLRDPKLFPSLEGVDYLQLGKTSAEALGRTVLECAKHRHAKGSPLKRVRLEKCVEVPPRFCDELEKLGIVFSQVPPKKRIRKQVDRLGAPLLD